MSMTCHVTRLDDDRDQSPTEMHVSKSELLMVSCHNPADAIGPDTVCP